MDLNNRDLLLLVQLVEQNGIEETDLIYEEFINHKVFKLSHNELNNNKIKITKEELKNEINNILNDHKDKNIIEICEFFYKKRIDEIKFELLEIDKNFTEIKSSA